MGQRGKKEVDDVVASSPCSSLSPPPISCKALLSRCGNFIFATNLQSLLHPHLSLSYPSLAAPPFPSIPSPRLELNTKFHLHDFRPTTDGHYSIQIDTRKRKCKATFLVCSFHTLFHRVYIIYMCVHVYVRWCLAASFLWVPCKYYFRDEREYTAVENDGVLAKETCFCDELRYRINVNSCNHPNT